MANRNTTQENSSSKRGFASMPHDKVEAIARKGGEASARNAGSKEMARRGQLGGEASARNAGHEGMAARGRHGGEVTASRVGHEGMAARGQRGGQASGASRKEGNEEDE